MQEAYVYTLACLLVLTDLIKESLPHICLTWLNFVLKSSRLQTFVLLEISSVESFFVNKARATQTMAGWSSSTPAKLLSTVTVTVTLAKWTLGQNAMMRR